MHNYSLEQKLLIILAPTLVIFQIAIFQFLVNDWDNNLGYLSGYISYWIIWCIPLSLVFSRKRFIVFKSTRVKRIGWLPYTLLFLPVISTYIAVFTKYAPLSGLKVILLALLFACINAPLEELLWRRVYPSYFPKSIVFGYLFPTLFFAGWHLAPALVKEFSMDGGILAFVGGALFMGIIWGWFSYRYKTIIPTTIAHLLTNFFAFTGFLYVNWFS